MLTQPSPSPHSHPVRQHPCFPHRPARSLSSTRGPMWERRGEPQKAGSLLPTQRPGLRHQSRGAPAVPHLPSASLMCYMEKTCKHRPSHASVRTAVLLTPPAPNQEPTACVPCGGWPASPRPHALVLCSTCRDARRLAMVTVHFCVECLPVQAVSPMTKGRTLRLTCARLPRA